MWQCASLSLLILLIVSIIIPRELLEQHLMPPGNNGKSNTELMLDKHTRRLIFQSTELYNTKETVNSTKHGNCANAIPVIVLEMASTESSASLGNIFTARDIATNFTHSMQQKFGMLRFKIVDVVFQENTPKVCHHGEHVIYSAAKCMNEGVSTNRNHSYYNGGNGYDVRIVKTSRHAVIWDPVIDNRDGTYTVDLRIEDPGEYIVEVYQNNKNGCHFADCDCPHCDTVEYLASRMKMCSKVLNGPCVRLVASRKLIVATEMTREIGQSAQILPLCAFSSLGNSISR